MRTGLWSDFKSVLLASVIALLVWVYAEGQSLTSRTINISVGIVNDPTAGVSLRAEDAGFRGSARVRLEGTARSMDDAAARLGTSVRLGPGSPGMPTEPGRLSPLDLRASLGALPELSGLGSMVAEVDPPFVNVQVTRLVERELPVRVEFAGSAALPAIFEAEPEIIPAVVRMKCSESVATGLQDGALAVAVVAESELERLRESGGAAGAGGESITAVVRAPASIAASSEVLMLPETVTVRVRLRRHVQTVTIAAVPVWYTLPPAADASGWTIDILDKQISDVNITGTHGSPELRALATPAGQSSLRAILELTADDLKGSGGEIKRPVTFLGLPTTVGGGLSASAPDMMARVRLTRKDGSKP